MGYLSINLARMGFFSNHSVTLQLFGSNSLFLASFIFVRVCVSLFFFCYTTIDYFVHLEIVTVFAFSFSDPCCPSSLCLSVYISLSATLFLFFSPSTCPFVFLKTLSLPLPKFFCYFLLLYLRGK